MSLSMRPDNKGLTVKINLFPLDQRAKDFDSKYARLWIRGKVTNAQTKKGKMFNDAGELISILGKWNAVRFKQLRGLDR
jgi:hypothetical protein